MDEVSAEGEAMASKMEGVGKKLRTVGLALTGIGIAGMLAMKSLVTKAAEIESAFANVNTMLAAGQDAYKLYNDGIDNLITSIPVAGGKVEALAGLYQVLSAGVEGGASAMLVLEESMKAAKAGVSSTAVAVDAITTILNAYQVPAEQASEISDILFATVKSGKTTFDELAHAIGPVVAIGAQVGVSFAETAATLATLTKAGIATDLAATSLRSTMVAFLKPSDAMKASVAEMGYASAAAMLEAEGLQGSIKILTGAVDGDAAAIAELFPEIRSLTAVMPLIGEMASVAAEDLETMENAIGAAGDAYAKQADTINSKTEILSARMEIAKEAIADGAAPAMLKAKEAGVKLAEALARANEKTGGAIGMIMVYGSKVAAAVGPLIALIGQVMIYRAAKAAANAATNAGTVSMNVSKVSMLAHAIATKVVAAAQWIWNAALYACPLVWIIALIIALIAIIVLLVKYWDKISKAVGNFAKGVKEKLGALWSWMKEGWNKMKSAAMGAWNGLKNIAGSAAKGMKRAIETRLKMAKWFADKGKEWGDKLKDGITSIGEKMKGWFSDQFEKWLDINKKLFDIGRKLMEALREGILSMGDKIKEACEWIADGIKDFFGGSLPETGPLKHIVEMGEDLMGGYTRGMVRGAALTKSDLASALGGLAAGGGATNFSATLNVPMTGTLDDGQLHMLYRRLEQLELSKARRATP